MVRLHESRPSEWWQSGLMRSPAKGVGVKASQVRILPIPPEMKDETEKWNRRENKRRKKRWGMRVDGAGLRLLARLVPKKKSR